VPLRITAKVEASLSMPWRLTGDWKQNCIYLYPRHWMKVNGQVQATAALPPRKGPRNIHWIGGYLGLRACMDLLHERTIRAMYVLPNTEARSCNHCCSGIAITITYSQCVSVALCIKNALRMGHIVIYGLSGSAILFTLSHKITIFEKYY
jgi:hypothetical protein